VELHPALPEAEAAGGGSTKSREPPTLLPPSRRGDLRDGGQWKWVPVPGGRQILSRAPSPAQLPLSNRYGALECEGPANEDVGEGPSGGLPRTSQSAPHITTALAKKKRRVIVIGDSLLRGTEGPIC